MRPLPCARAARPALALLAALAACGDTGNGDTGNGDGAAVEDSARVEAAPDRAQRAPVEAGPDASAPVRVWLTRGEALVAVPRPGVEPSLRSALEALVAGPTAEERRRGLSSWFGDETRDVLRDTRVASGRAVVDFRSSLPRLIPGAGSSAGSEVLLGALDSTTFQFPGIEAVEYRLNGSCEAFWAWLQRECTVVRR